MANQGFSIPQGTWIEQGGTPTISFYKFIFNLWNQAAAAGIPNGTIYSNISGVKAPPTANTLTAVMDALIASTRGALAVRGAASWGGLALGAVNTLVGSDGTDTKFRTLTAVLDAVIGSGEGTIAVRGAASWQALALGTTGQALVSDGTDLVAALVSQLAATITLAAAGTITTAAGGLTVGSFSGDVTVGSGTGTTTLGTSGGTLKTGQTVAAAAVPANFSATHIITIKDGSGTTYRIPADSAAW